MRSTKQIKKEWCVSVAAALLSTIFLPEIADLNGSLYAFSNSVLSLLVAVALAFFYHTALCCTEKRVKITSLILGVLFSFFLCIGNQLLKHGSTNLDRWKVIIAIFAEIPLFASAVGLLMVKLSGIQAVKFPNEVKEPSRRILFFCTWSIIFLCWIPAFLAAYPGIYGYDAIYQVQAYSAEKIYLHHPLIHNLHLGFCIQKLGTLLGSPECGMAIYSISQMLMLSACFAGIYVYLRRNKIPKLFAFGLLLWFMAMPTNMLMSFSATKDVLFSASFAWMIINLSKLSKNPEIIRSVKFDVSFLLSCFTQMIFRNQGKYLFLILVPLLIVTFWEYRKRIACICCGVLIMFSVYSGPVTTMLRGIPATNGIKEMMSVPCVQLSRAMWEQENDLTEEEKILIREYVPGYEIYQWVPGISDEMKRDFNQDRFKENPKEFIKLWVSVGCKAPMSYIDAWARLSIGLWYPDMNYNDYAAVHPYWEYDNTSIEFREQGYTVVERTVPVSLKWLNQWFTKLTNDSMYKEVPVISMLFSSAMPFWLLLLGIGYCVVQRMYRLLIPGAAMFLLWLTMMLGPVVLFRYVYPLMVCIPVFWGTILSTEYNKIVEKAN